jgi:tRNA A-37 threonylcarbamoyl transferase component Bud32
MSDLSNSNETAIRNHAPQTLAQAFQATLAKGIDSRDKLRLRLAFVESLLRYCFAVLAAENAGLGLAVPDGCTNLINRFTTPSWGDWSKALEALAKNVLEAGDAPIAPAFAQLVIEQGDGGAYERTAFFQDIIQIIDLRNTQLAHNDDGSVGCTEAEAVRYLHDVVNPSLQRICQQLRVLVHHPLLYAVETKPQLDGDYVTKVMRLVGTAPEMQELRTDEDPRLKSKTAFLLDATGNALYLSPFVMVESMSVSGQPAPRVIAGWSLADQQPKYDRIDGAPRSVLGDPPGGMPQSPAALFSLPTRLFRHDGALDSELAAELVKASRRRAPSDLPGLEIDEDRPLGAGASGVVYRARWSPGGQTPSEWVAVKVLHDETLTDVQRRRLREEYHVLRRITHPSLPTVHDYRELPLPHFIMEKITGTSLQARIQRRPLPLELVVDIALQVLEVLEVVHDHGVVHRDLKPSNIMLLDGDPAKGVAVKVIDFGIALTDPHRRFTGSLDFLGSQGFAAPEQFRKGEIDRRVDIYALGRVIQAALIGDRDDRIDMIPPGMQAIIHQATHENPADRFSSALEMKVAINGRREGAWQGVPVQENSPLDHNHDLLAVKHMVENVWIFDAIETRTGRREAIALAAEPAAREALLRAVGQQPDGSCTTQTTGPHSILFTILPPDDEADRLERLLTGRLLWTAKRTPRRTSPASASREVADADDSLIGYLQGDSEAGLLRRVLLQRIRELKTVADESASDEQITPTTFEAFSAFESMLLVFALHAARPGIIDVDVWNSCPPTLGGILAWIEKLRIPYPELPPLLESLRRVTEIRNQLAHHVKGRASPQEVSHAIVYACILLENAVAAQIPESKRGDVPPFLTYDPDHHAWSLLRNRRGEEVREYFTLQWNPSPIDEKQAAQEGRQTRRDRVATQTIENTRRLAEYLGGRPYAKEVILNAAAHPSRKGSRGREADIAVYAEKRRVVLIAEIKVARRSDVDDLDTARLEEQLWLTVQAFEAPFAVLDRNGVRTWFAADAEQGLREMPDDSEIVARFGPKSADA